MSWRKLLFKSNASTSNLARWQRHVQGCLQRRLLLRCQTVLVEGVSQLPNKTPCHWVYQVTLLLCYVSNEDSNTCTSWTPTHLLFLLPECGYRPRRAPWPSPILSSSDEGGSPTVSTPCPRDKSAELHHLTSEMKQVCRWDRRWGKFHTVKTFFLFLY